MAEERELRANGWKLRAEVYGAAGWSRTSDKGFADLCLATWRPRQSQLTGLAPARPWPEGNPTPTAPSVEIAPKITPGKRAASGEYPEAACFSSRVSWSVTRTLRCRERSVIRKLPSGSNRRFSIEPRKERQFLQVVSKPTQHNVGEVRSGQRVAHLEVGLAARFRPILRFSSIQWESLV